MIVTWGRDYVTRQVHVVTTVLGREPTTTVRTACAHTIEAHPRSVEDYPWPAKPEGLLCIDCLRAVNSGRVTGPAGGTSSAKSVAR